MRTPGKNETPLVLASGSVRRQQLLQGLGLTFEVVVSGASEAIDVGASPEEVVRTLANRKALEVQSRLNEKGHSPCVILAADTVVVLDGQILGKPVSAQHAQQMLSALQGKEHEVYTGVCLTSTPHPSTRDPIVRIAHSSTLVRMRNLTTAQIQRYVATGEPLDKAGSYGIQGFGSTLIDSITGDYFTVVGLPLALVTDMLEEFGISIW